MTSVRPAVASVLARTRAASRGFVGVVARKRTYGALAYLLLAFPLGIGYVVFLALGFAIPAGLAFAVVDVVTSGSLVLLVVSVSLALVGLVVAVPTALGVLFVASELTAFERLLAARLLGADVPTADPADTVRQRARRLVLDHGTWRGVGYLFSRFVIGVVSFVLLAFGTAFSYALLAAPFHYREDRVGIHVADPIEVVPAFTYRHEGWTVDLVSPFSLAIADGELVSTYATSLEAALVVSAVGAVVGLVVLHLFTAFARLSARYTELALRGTQPSILADRPWE